MSTLVDSIVAAIKQQFPDNMTPGSLQCDVRESGVVTTADIRCRFGETQVFATVTAIK